MFPSNALSDDLSKLNVDLRRFKTGTPPRVNRNSVDFSELEEQIGDEEITPFSFSTPSEKLENKEVCHITYTNENTKKIIQEICSYVCIILLVIFIKMFIVSPIRVNGNSMYNTLVDQDIMILNEAIYNFTDIKISNIKGDANG